MNRTFTCRASGALFLALALTGITAAAQKLDIERNGATVVIEPYAPNIVRVTISLDKARAEAPPGYGIIAKPDSTGWTTGSSDAGDTFSSSRIVVTVPPQGPHYTPTGTQADIAKFFGGSTPGVSLSVKTPEGDTLLQMRGWQMAIPNHKDGDAGVLNDRRPTDDPFYRVGASFAAPKDEHYYGLGQNQEGYLDRRGHTVRCAHDYNAPGGQSVCVPFVVTNKGYGVVWDNPSATTVSFCVLGNSTRWTSDVGQRVSFFVIAGKTYDEIYAGYRLLTGDVPMLPKSAYGYIQCKQRYTSQDAVDGRRQGLSRPPSAHRRPRHRLVQLHQDGRDGHGPRQVARPRRDELKQLHAMNFHVDDQRVAALHPGGPLLRHAAEEWLV